MRTRPQAAQPSATLPSVYPNTTPFDPEHPSIKHDILLMIVQYLRDQGFVMSSMTLQDEASVQLRTGEERASIARRLRECVLDGSWDKVHQMLDMRKPSNASNGGGSASTVSGANSVSQGSHTMAAATAVEGKRGPSAGNEGSAGRGSSSKGSSSNNNSGIGSAIHGNGSGGTSSSSSSSSSSSTSANTNNKKNSSIGGSSSASPRKAKASRGAKGNSARKSDTGRDEGSKDSSSTDKGLWQRERDRQRHVIPLSAHARLALKYAACRQQLIEMVDSQQLQRAHTFLNKRIKPLEPLLAAENDDIEQYADGYENSNINAFAFIGHGSEWKGYAADFRDLCYLLTCTSVTEVPSLRNWGGRSASRRALAATFNRALRAESLLAADLGSIAGMGGGDTFFSRHDEEERDKRDDDDDGPSLVRGSGAGRRPEVMPEHRLVTLLQQAMAYQIDRARYRPVAQPRVFVGTLLRDYRCFAIPNACKAVYSGHEANVKAVAFAGAGGERIISGSSDCTVRVWSSEPPMAQIEEDVDGVQNIDASMDRAEREGGLQGSVQERAIAQSGPISVKSSIVLSGHVSRVWDVAWFPGAELASHARAAATGQRRRGAQHRRRKRGGRGIGEEEAANANGAIDGLGFILSCSGSGSIKLWKGAQAASASGKAIEAGQGAVTSSTYTSSWATRKSGSSTGQLDSTRVNYRAGSRSGAERVDTESWECVADFLGHRGDCYTVCPSSSGLSYGAATPGGGNYIAQTVFCSGGYDRTVRLFRPFGTRTRSAVQTLSGHGASVTSVAFGSHGGLVVSGSKDSTIKFWDINSGVCVHTLSAHLGEVTSVAFSSDGRHLLSASKDNSNRLWDVRMGRTLRRYKGHQNITRNLCKAGFAACDSVVYSGSEDGCAWAWDAETGETLRGRGGRLVGHRAMVYATKWSEPQSLLVSCSEDSTLRTWWDNGRT